jgi:hypothetical protein
MKLITISIEVDDDVVVRSVKRKAAIPLSTKRTPARRKQAETGPVTTPTGTYKYRSASPEAVVETASGQMVRAFFAKRVRPVRTAAVGKLFEKHGLSKTTATPVLSALVRTGHITRIKPGIFARKA